MSESRPLLKTRPTRQTYLACPETIDPYYRKPDDELSIRRCSSFSQSICQAKPDDENNIPRTRCSSKDSTTNTLNDSIEDDTMSFQQQLSDQVAYIQYLEKLFDRFSSSVYLENNVAVARDHLANERTYLAWVRTSLSVISIGVGITQLFRLDKDVVKDPTKVEDMLAIGKPMGMTFVVIGLFYMVFAFIRYFHSQVAMTKGYFPASRGIIVISSTATITALIAVFITLLNQKY